MKTYNVVYKKTFLVDFLYQNVYQGITQLEQNCVKDDC